VGVLSNHPATIRCSITYCAKSASRTYINDIFGDQTTYFKYSLVDAARFCDNILAVGDCVVDELKFLAPEFKVADIDLTYNGIPAYETTLAEKYQSRDKLRDYRQNLLMAS
jgi:hypothetical protein